MTELLVRPERFELLEFQVKDLSKRLTENTKWQNALGKWLLNTFKLDVRELALAEEPAPEVEAEVQPARRTVEIENIGCTSPVAVAGHSRRSVPRPRRPRVPPKKRKRVVRKGKSIAEKYSPHLRALAEELASIHKNDRLNRQKKPRTDSEETSATPTPIPISSRTLRSNSKAIDSPTVSVTRLPDSVLEQHLNSSGKSLGKIEILPSEKVTSSLFLNSTDNDESSEMENAEEGFVLEEYNSQMILKEEPVCLNGPGIIHGNFDQGDEGPRNSDIAQTDSALQSILPNEDRFEADDIYLFNGHNPEHLNNIEEPGSSNCYVQNQYQSEDADVDDPLQFQGPGTSVSLETPSNEKKKRRRRQRITSLVPNKPKKALTAYAMFMKEYFEARQGQGYGPSNSQFMAELSVEWKSMTPERRAYYESKCAEDKNRYNDAIKVWKTQRAFVRRAPSAFALFLKATWESEKAAGRHRKVSEMGKIVSTRWKAMTVEQQAPYQRQHEILKAQKETRLRELAAGNVTMDAAGNMLLNPPLQNPIAPSTTATAEFGPESDEDEEDVMDESHNFDGESVNDSNNFGDSIADDADVDVSLDADNLFATI